MKILMHMCCGPCAVYPASVLHSEGIEIEGFFYNPNIHPLEEFQKRSENCKKLCNIKNIPFIFECDIMQDKWESFTGTEEARCRMCYSLRLDRAARFAAENGFDAFTTSLLVSPYQKHELIRELGDEYGKRHGISFYYRDFRPGFREGQQMARELELYRQKFCGCIVSFRESKLFQKTK